MGRCGPVPTWCFRTSNAPLGNRDGPALIALRTVHEVETPCVCGLSTEAFRPRATIIIRVGGMRVKTVLENFFGVRSTTRAKAAVHHRRRPRSFCVFVRPSLVFAARTAWRTGPAPAG